MSSQRKAIQGLARRQLQRLRCRYFSNTSPHAKTALVLGANGALGSAIASHLKAENSRQVASCQTARSCSSRSVNLLNRERPTQYINGRTKQVRFPLS